MNVWGCVEILPSIIQRRDGNTFTLQAEVTFSRCELAREKAAPADNRSIFYRSCLKSVTRFASKINRQVCRQMAQVSRE